VNTLFQDSIPLDRFSLWEKTRSKRSPFSFTLEFTARCNNNCRHCTVNLPAEDRAAKNRELSLDETKEIIDEAVSLGALWCLITGGEPPVEGGFFRSLLIPEEKPLPGIVCDFSLNALRVKVQAAKVE
jgi:MoaA/NifB/PqqE/SkfB family radical SAM enzyme